MFFELLSLQSSLKLGTLHTHCIELLKVARQHVTHILSTENSKMHVIMYVACVWCEYWTTVSPEATCRYIHVDLHTY